MDNAIEEIARHLYRLTYLELGYEASANLLVIDDGVFWHWYEIFSLSYFSSFHLLCARIKYIFEKQYNLTNNEYSLSIRQCEYITNILIQQVYLTKFYEKVNFGQARLRC